VVRPVAILRHADGARRIDRRHACRNRCPSGSDQRRHRRRVYDLCDPARPVCRECGLRLIVSQPGASAVARQGGRESPRRSQRTGCQAPRQGQVTRYPLTAALSAPYHRVGNRRARSERYRPFRQQLQLVPSYPLVSAADRRVADRRRGGHAHPEGLHLLPTLPIGFSVFVEMINLRSGRRRPSRCGCIRHTSRRRVSEVHPNFMRRDPEGMKRFGPEVHH